MSKDKYAACAMLLMGILFVANVPAVHAAESYDNCTGFIDSLPATISKQGTWCLRKDVSTSISSGYAILLAANNVTVDCNDFKIGGLAAGMNTATVGIGTGDTLRSNLVVRNCNIRGFRRGLVILGSGHLVEDNRLEGNTYTGIYVVGDGSVIQRNQVRDTGGTNWEQGYAYAITGGETVHVLDNTVEGVLPALQSGNAWAYGIYTFDNAGGSIRGNRVSGLIGSGEGGAFGIQNYASGLISVVDNHVVSGGGKVGISCAGWNNEPAVHNVVLGFVTPIAGCYDGGNTTPPLPQ